MSSKTTYNDHLPERYLWLAIGVAINSLGIVLITKGSLGTVISAVLVGRLVNLLNGRAPLLGHITGLVRG